MAGAGWHRTVPSLRAVRSGAAAELRAEELRSAWWVRVRLAPAAQYLRVAEVITGTASARVVTATGTAQDGKGAATISTLAIGASGSDSAGAMEMILTVGAGLLPVMFGFAVIRTTETELTRSK